jgi:hypothetical protein
VPIYTYSVQASGGYAPNSNITNYRDSITGTWNMQYDSLNRLHTATTLSGTYSSSSSQSTVINWEYDSFGNRLRQSVVGNPRMSAPSAWATYNSNNQMTANQLAPDLKTLNYDDAGDMIFDGTNQVKYDAENRVCAVGAFNAATQNTTITLYISMMRKGGEWPRGTPPRALLHRIVLPAPATSRSTKPTSLDRAGSKCLRLAKDAPFNGFAEPGTLTLFQFLHLVQPLEKEQVGDLFDDFDRIGNAPRPESVPDAVNLIAYFACKHVPQSYLNVGPINGNAVLHGLRTTGQCHRDSAPTVEDQKPYKVRGVRLVETTSSRPRSCTTSTSYSW